MATREQIVTANRATFEAWNAHDPDAVAAVFAEDAVIRDVGSPEPPVMAVPRSGRAWRT